MRKALLALTAVGLMASGTLTACSDGEDEAETGSATVTTEGAGNGQSRVGVILPDEKSSARWKTYDPLYLKTAFDKAKVPVQIVNARGDKDRFKQLAADMVNNGVKVLIIVSLDAVSGRAAIEAAHAKKVPVIDYDRLTLGAGADFYVSFDNVAVGRLQAQGLENCFGKKRRKGQMIAYLNGSESDNNATLFKEGSDEVLQDLFDYGTYTKGPEQSVPEWDNDEARAIFEQMHKQFPGIDGVLAANDGLGNAAIEVLRKKGLNGKVPVTGQDATVQGLQNILVGDQCMTVYKNIRDEAAAAAELAISLYNGAPTNTADKIKDPVSGAPVPFKGLKPQAINKENMKFFVHDNAIAKKDVCTPKFVEACKDAGIE